MHEISLVRSIFSTLVAELPEAEQKQLTAIYLRVGSLANVEPVLMQNAFQAVLETEYPERHLTLHIETLPVLVLCDSCGKTSEVENYKFVCVCGKPTAHVVQGNELLISKIEFENQIVNT